MPETKPESPEPRATRAIREALRDLHRDNNVDLPDLAKILGCSEDEALEEATRISSKTVAVIDCLAGYSSEPESFGLLLGISTKRAGRSSPFSDVFFTEMETLKSDEAILELFGLMATSVLEFGKRLIAKGYLLPPSS